MADSGEGREGEEGMGRVEVQTQGQQASQGHTTAMEAEAPEDPTATPSHSVDDITKVVQEILAGANGTASTSRGGPVENSTIAQVYAQAFHRIFNDLSVSEGSRAASLSREQAVGDQHLLSPSPSTAFRQPQQLSPAPTALTFAVPQIPYSIGLSQQFDTAQLLSLPLAHQEATRSPAHLLNYQNMLRDHLNTHLSSSPAATQVRAVAVAKRSPRSRKQNEKREEVARTVLEKGSPQLKTFAKKNPTEFKDSPYLASLLFDDSCKKSIDKPSVSRPSAPPPTAPSTASVVPSNIPAALLPFVNHPSWPSILAAYQNTLQTNFEQWNKLEVSDDQSKTP